MQWAPLATNPFQTTRDLKLYTQKALGADKVQRLRNPYSYSRLRCRTTALRERYINCHYWHRWLHNQGIKGLPVHSALTEHNDKTSLTTQGWWWYLIYQFAGWMPIGLSCGCAAAISYTTPIVSRPGQPNLWALSPRAHSSNILQNISYTFPVLVCKH